MGLFFYFIYFFFFLLSNKLVARYLITAPLTLICLNSISSNLK